MAAPKSHSQGMSPDLSADEHTTILAGSSGRRYDGDNPPIKRMSSIRFTGIENVRPPIMNPAEGYPHTSRQSIRSIATVSDNGDRDAVVDRIATNGRGGNNINNNINNNNNNIGVDADDDDSDDPSPLRRRAARAKRPIWPGPVRKAWNAVTARYNSIELENKGSVARDHLALERTFLAWVRTSLSFASIGIAVTQLFRLNTTITAPDENAAGIKPAGSMFGGVETGTKLGGGGGGGLADFITDSVLVVRPTSESDAQLRRVGKPLGATFLCVAMLTLFVGFHRYFEGQHYVLNGRFPASRGSVMILAFVAGSLIVSSLIVVVAIGAGKFET